MCMYNIYIYIFLCVDVERERKKEIVETWRARKGKLGELHININLMERVL